MGKGDKKSLRGKIAMGSFGKKRARKRPHKVSVKPVSKATAVDETPVKAVSKPKAAKKSGTSETVAPVKKKVVKKPKKEAE